MILVNEKATDNWLMDVFFSFCGGAQITNSYVLEGRLLDEVYQKWMNDFQIRPGWEWKLN